MIINKKFLLPAVVSALVVLLGVNPLYAGSPMTLDPEIPNGEKLVYRINDANHQKIFSLIYSTTITKVEGEKYYKIDGEVDELNKTGALIRSRDFKPVSCYYSYNNSKTGEFWNYASSWDWNLKQAVFLEKSKLGAQETNNRSDFAMTSGAIYDFYINHLGITRGIDPQAVKNGETYSMNVFINKMVGVLNATMRFVREEEISVPAGTFRCYKIKLEPELNLVASSLATVLSPQGVDSYFWISVEKPHTIVKLEMAFAPLGEREMLLEKVELPKVKVVSVRK